MPISTPRLTAEFLWALQSNPEFMLFILCWVQSKIFQIVIHDLLHNNGLLTYEVERFLTRSRFLKLKVAEMNRFPPGNQTRPAWSPRALLLIQRA